MVKLLPPYPNVKGSSPTTAGTIDKLQLTEQNLGQV
jgi:hypothetical protein